jgi:two-component system, OmpR family, response regulator
MAGLECIRDERSSCDVLIIDDEPNIRNPLKRLIENHFPGRRVEVAANGIDAALRLSRLRPVVVLLDLVMPGSGDGWMLLDQVRRDQDPDLAATRFIVVSGRIDQESVDRACVSEVPFVLKPFDFDELFGLVEKTLSASESLENNVL